jgi:hypothetical protein
MDYEIRERVGSKRFFFEKKKQKTFAIGSGAFRWHGLNYKLFCFFFVRKKKCFLQKTLTRPAIPTAFANRLSRVISVAPKTSASAKII